MKNTILKISILSLLFVSCEKLDTSAQYIYQPPEDIKDGFDVGSLEEVNIDASMIAKAVGRIYQGKYKREFGIGNELFPSNGSKKVLLHLPVTGG